MKDIEFLKKLCTSHAPSGREHWLYPVVKDAFEPFGELSLGKLNNIYAYKKGKGKESIMLMAHADEVFLMVTELCENGFLKFKSNGIDAKTLVSQEVYIHGKEKVLGIIGIKPPHLMSEEDRKKAIAADDLLIDTGLSKEKLQALVNIGDYVTLKRNFYELLNNNVICKSVDDRAGIAAMYACAKELNNITHDLDVYFVASCQEEVGHRGARVGSFEVNPTMAIAIDVTFDSGPMGATERENYLGEGPVISIGPNIHPKFRKKLTDIAKEYNIPYQVEVEPGDTGTDAWDIQVVGDGIPTLLISIPIKYMHTSVEMVNIEDIKNTGRIMAKFIEKLRSEEVEELLCF
ncbi:M42 family metallopeptidase [Clostridium swellfunianum]|uniref:M42 family metallopeptidase n=1 Tax=Clostridium swellfunianum TaxID=1367462 RepID=UPI00202F3945|nr:M42 family metallopeptidase [Clostridium swellfunianum]MCM0648229.1 M42 family metallopeptidase [Clostridium swellfunianum]